MQVVEGVAVLNWNSASIIVWLCENIFLIASSVCCMLLYCCLLQCWHVCKTPDLNNNIIQCMHTNQAVWSSRLQSCIVYMAYNLYNNERMLRKILAGKLEIQKINITFFPLSQAANLVAPRLRLLNAMVNSTLSSNIPPSLTSDIWSSGGSNSDSYLSCTMHIVTKEMKLESYSLGALPLRDLAHNQ